MCGNSRGKRILGFNTLIVIWTVEEVHRSSIPISQSRHDCVYQRGFFIKHMEYDVKNIGQETRIVHSTPAVLPAASVTPCVRFETFTISLHEHGELVACIRCMQAMIWVIVDRAKMFS